MFNQNQTIMEITEKVDRVSLDLISVSGTNKMFRSAKQLSEAALKELSDSITELDVIQPIALRPDPNQPGKFILICGERRFKASRQAGKQDIPAYIRNVDESEAFEMQMTENLQREDIHALNEAKGYKHLMEKYTLLTTADLALRFGKSESYILQRLKLNDLVSEAKRDFYEDRMSIGHAILLARLTPQDQRAAIQRISDSDSGYGTIAELQSFVNRNIINNLSVAPFQMDDADLIKKAGPCTLCPKRTGCSPLLFSDIKETDRCMDRNCFLAKCNTFLIKKTKETIETHPEILFLVDYNGPIPEVAEMLEEHRIKPLKEYDDFNNNDRSGKKVKALWLSGNRAGFTQTIHIKEKSSHVNAEEDETTVVAKIQSRIKRGRELDQEKVYSKIIEALKNHPTQKIDSKKLQRDEEVFLWFIVLDKAGYGIKHALRKIIGTSKEDPARLYQQLKDLKPGKKALLLRKVILDQYSGIYPNSDYGYIIRKIAEGYGDIDIASFEKEQVEVQTKRESKAKERIKLLQQKK
jgi:ParB/RepB/Spo0J family partition protein